MNPCIVSFFMSNIDPKTVELQRKVVAKYNRSGVRHYQIQVDMPHGVAMDYFWALCGSPVEAFEDKIAQQVNHDAVLFLDIDAFPVVDRAIDTYLAYAYEGHLAGNAQSSNHIGDGQHMFAAPSAVTMSKDTYDKLGRPSAYENPRADVGEEWTYAARERKIPVDLAMPVCYDEAPFRYDWEPKDAKPYWDLAEGFPKYGVGTTFGDKLGKLFYHQFQIRIPGMQEKFWKKAESILAE
jgi:hypothetical protein